MATPNWAQGFLGRVVDRVLPGQNYDTRTGQYRNVGQGIAGLGARIAASAFLGPAAGAAVGKIANTLINRHDPGPVVPERIGLVNPGLNIGYTPRYSAQAQMIAPSLSDPGTVQSPGGSWRGYMEGAGSINNFGNTQFGAGTSSLPGQWSPSSLWGQQVGASQGSQLGFGNNVDSFSGVDTGGYGSSSIPGMFGGRLAGDSMLDVARSWSGNGNSRHDQYLPGMTVSNSAQ